MKRNWDLIRKILLKLETTESTAMYVKPQDFKEYNNELVSYQINLLFQAGLIEAIPKKTIGTPLYCIAKSLTWDGHEFLDKIRNDSVWEKIKSTIKDNGIDLSIEAIKFTAANLIKAMLS